MAPSMMTNETVVTSVGTPNEARAALHTPGVEAHEGHFFSMRYPMRRTLEMEPGPSFLRRYPT